MLSMYKAQGLILLHWGKKREEKSSLGTKGHQGEAVGVQPLNTHDFMSSLIHQEVVHVRTQLYSAILKVLFY